MKKFKGCHYGCRVPPDVLNKFCIGGNLYRVTRKCPKCKMRWTKVERVSRETEQVEG